MPSAGPARPRRAIWWPSSVVTTDEDLARNVDQDRRGRAAVLRAVIDAGEHDQRRRGLQPEGERQQHGDRRHRPDARQHADQRAEKAADEAVEKILPAQRDAQPEREIVQRLHSALTNSATAAAAARAARRTPPTENTIMTAASASVSSGRTSREAMRPDQHQHGDRGDEAEPLQRDPEQHDSEQREADRPRVKARHRVRRRTGTRAAR